MDQDKDYLERIAEAFKGKMNGPIIPAPTLDGFAALLKQRQGGSTDTAKGYADGGEVPDDPTTQVPPMGQMLQNVQQIPATNPAIYQGVNADQRAALYKQLLDQQKSTPNLAAQAVGGLGDAISNSFGGQHNTFQNDAANIAAKNTENRIGGMDTQRAQRAQDFGANQEMMMSDPSSNLSKGMQAIMKSQGINVPSGMNAKVMLQALGPLGELAYKQAMMGMQSTKNNADIANQRSERKLEAGKALESRPIVQKLRDFVSPSAETQALREEITDKSTQSHGIPDLGATFNGGKVMKVTKVD